MPIPASWQAGNVGISGIWLGDWYGFTSPSHDVAYIKSKNACAVHSLVVRYSVVIEQVVLQT